MNILLWVLQALLALHTVAGAIWKFSHSAEQTMPTLQAIPLSAWRAMAIIELLCSLGLIIPVFSTSLGILVPIAAIIIAVEMLFFTALHFASGASNYGPVIYWLVVAALSFFIAWGRFVLKPF